MSVQREPSGDLCGVRDHGHQRLRCGGLCVAHLDVPTDTGNYELAICQIHWDELHASQDPIQLAREWVR